MIDRYLDLAKPDQCELCQELSIGCGDTFHQLFPDIDNRVFSGSEPGLVVVPSIGALSTGHVLLLPKAHSTSMAEASRRGLNVGSAAQALRSIIEADFGPAILFEHGSASDNSSGGCGVTHAHMHCMPCNWTDDPPGDLEWTAGSEEDWVGQPPGTDYLMFSPNPSHLHICKIERLESQWVRARVATKLGVSNWNWRNDSRTSEVRATLRWMQASELNSASAI